MSYTLFCPVCESFIAISQKACLACKQWQRPAEERFLHPDEPLWKARLGGFALGAPMLAGPRIFFAWASPQGGGGVSAFYKETGLPAWPAPHLTANEPANGLTPFGDALLLATHGFLDAGAVLQALSQADGSPLWPEQPLQASAWSAPILLDDARIIVICANGWVHSFDASNGKPVPHFPVQPLPFKGKMWGAIFRRQLILLHKDGMLFSINPFEGTPAWMNRLETGAKISSPPLVHDKEILFGTCDGRLIALDPLHLRMRTLAEGFKGILAAPVAKDSKTIVVGGSDHTLRALEYPSGRELWRHKMGQGIVAPAAVRDGKVYVTANDRQLACLEEENGHPGWSFGLGEQVPQLGAPLMQEDVVYIGSADGSAYALPWHLGHYRWAGSWWQSHSGCEKAAPHYVWAASFELSAEKSKPLYLEAEQCWENAGQPEKAAHMWEAQGKWALSAEDFCKAAENRRGYDPLHAAEYYYRASRLYWRLGKRPEEIHTSVEASRLGHWPSLRLDRANAPVAPQGRPRQVTFRLENTGFSPARDLHITIGGTLLQMLDFRVPSPLPDASYFNLTFDMAPTTLRDTLSVAVEYNTEPPRPRPFEAFHEIVVESSRAPASINLGHVINGKVRVFNPHNEPLDLITGHLVRSEIDYVVGSPGSREGTTDTQPTALLVCPSCDAENDLDANNCIKCGKLLEPEPGGENSAG